MAYERKPEKESKTFRLDSTTLRTLERLAEAENRTVNNMVETVLKEAVKKREALSV